MSSPSVLISIGSHSAALVTGATEGPLCNWLHVLSDLATMLFCLFPVCCGRTAWLCAWWHQQSDVGRIYAEDEASVQMSLSPERVPELQILKRLVSMCFCFARKTYNDLCRDFGYKPEEILIYEPKSKVRTSGEL